MKKIYIIPTMVVFVSAFVFFHNEKKNELFNVAIDAVKDALVKPIELEQRDEVLKDSSEFTGQNFKKLDDTDERTPEQIKGEISNIEAYLEREDAISRLNRGDVTPAEREEYGQLFGNVVKLKARLIAHEIAEIEVTLRHVENVHQRTLEERKVNL